MLIIGAKGHAIEILGVIQLSSDQMRLSFYDDINKDDPDILFNTYPIVRTFEEAKTVFTYHSDFILGTGGCKARSYLFNKFSSIGGTPYSVIAPNASIGTEDVHLGVGINIMQFVFISNQVWIGKGTLINTRANIHHNVLIGNFCEICPSVTLTGGVEVGDHTFIGTGSIVLPNIKIGSNVVIGAGSIVTKNIPDNVKAFGNPAKIIL